LNFCLFSISSIQALHVFRASAEPPSCRLQRLAGHAQVHADLIPCLPPDRSLAQDAGAVGEEQPAVLLHGIGLQAQALDAVSVSVIAVLFF
jgi:hypothetical protein